MIVPVVLSGGAGSRLWPLSRELYPKQFLPLLGEHTMVQETVLRLSDIPDLQAPIVVCNEAHRFLVDEQLTTVGYKPSAVLLEPIGRNTAPALVLAAVRALEAGQDPLLLVLPADHGINEPKSLCKAVEFAAPLAEQGSLVTFGIVPTEPETGYGYIKRGDRQQRSEEGVEAYAVARFEEKPDKQTAENYLSSGDYYWNSGMFLFKASTYLEELKRFEPEMLACCQTAYNASRGENGFTYVDESSFSQCPSNSIDYAVMEKTEKAIVVPLDAGWSDVGSWSALWEIGQKDAAGNLTKGDVFAKNVKNTYVHADNRMVAAIGIENAVIVETADAVLVCDKDQVQDVKAIPTFLKQHGRSEAKLHRKVYRPWGCYESIDQEDRFQVKRITVNQGACLSSQMHHHRAEHWIVVKGTAKITKDDEVIILSENQSTYIPLGVTHRLENPGKIPLELIEVQSGSYLGEDDIVRFDDQYGRC